MKYVNTRNTRAIGNDNLPINTDAKRCLTGIGSGDQGCRYG